MPKYAARVDANQKTIVDGCRAAGYGMLHLHALGSSKPDLLMGAQDANILLEVKNPKRARWKQGRVENEVRESQRIFREGWPGPIYEIQTLEEALEIGERYGGPAGRG